MEEFLIEIKTLLDKQQLLESKKEETRVKINNLYNILDSCENEIELIQKDIEYKLKHYGEETYYKKDMKSIRKVFHAF